MLAPLRCATFALPFFVTACSMHPLPEDVTRKTTFDIVKRMRCEIRDGTRNRQFPITTPLETISVGFDFKFIITEDNDASAGKLKFTNPVSGGSFALDFAAEASKARTNERTFCVVDTLDKIRDEDGCDEVSQRANFVYPITGRIGLDETLVTFSRLRTMTGFNKLNDTSSDVFTDKLEFTTILSAGITPSLTIAAGQVGTLELTDYSVTGSAMRTDMHRVTVAIAIEDEKASQPKNADRSGPARSGPAAAADGRDDEFIEPMLRMNETPAAIPGPVLPKSTSSATSKVIEELNRQRVRDDLRDFPALRIP